MIRDEAFDVGFFLRPPSRGVSRVLGREREVHPHPVERAEEGRHGLDGIEWVGLAVALAKPIGYAAIDSPMKSGLFVRLLRCIRPSAPVCGFIRTAGWAMNGRKPAQGVASRKARKYAPVPPSEAAC